MKNLRYILEKNPHIYTNTKAYPWWSNRAGRPGRSIKATLSLESRDTRDTRLSINTAVTLQDTQQSCQPPHNNSSVQAPTALLSLQVLHIIYWCLFTSGTFTSK